MTLDCKITVAALLAGLLPIGVWALPVNAQGHANSNDSVSVQETVWTAVIPKGFPGNAYTWHLRLGGTYTEDGREVATGKAVQPTLSGKWRLAGRHMVLKQDGVGFVFDGNLVGDEYLGVLYLDGKRFARFCAVKGEAPPQNCTDISA
jgi:hypothetical protein